MIKRIIAFVILFLILWFLLATTISLSVDAKSKTETVDMGRFKITAYCPCYECSCNFGRRCAKKNTYARSNHTIAVDPDIIDLGSKVKVGKKTYYAEDTGGKVQGDIIDIFFDTHEEVVDFGVKYKNVKVIRKKN